MANFTATVDSPVGRFGVRGTEAGVTEILLPPDRPRPSAGRAPTPVAAAARQLAQYLAGTRTTFALTLGEVDATPFQRDVWAALTEIPYGEVRTYAEVAAAIGRPLAARAVGNANHHNPWPVVVPCHRVVAANGLGGYGGGDRVKRYLLALEGVSL
ncbi:MAG TPA: methylated-DNA--[protein]-cysteine S-methyltransferase [Acidimicrobiales bacterium]|nr:methylated-DNA--[protein]-cysteine S-methyltransferase [Acidimicrobiales bacterium]